MSRIRRICSVVVDLLIVGLMCFVAMFVYDFVITGSFISSELLILIGVNIYWIYLLGNLVFFKTTIGKMVFGGIYVGSEPKKLSFNSIWKRVFFVFLLSLVMSVLWLLYMFEILSPGLSREIVELYPNLLILYYLVVLVDSRSDEEGCVTMTDKFSSSRLVLKKTLGVNQS